MHAPRTPRLPWPRTEEDGTPRGVDLALLHEDVRRLVLARFRVLPPGIDRDDLVAEVLLAIARKNHQPCAYDPRLAGLGKYVNKVAFSTLMNLLERERRHELPHAETGDAAEVVSDDDSIDLFHDYDALRDAPEQLWERALRLRRAEQAAERLWAADPHRQPVQTGWTW